MRIRIRHETSYRYPKPAIFGPHTIRLCPADHAGASVLSYNLQLNPEAEVRWQRDPWGNRIARATFSEGTQSDSLTLVVDAAFDIRPVNPFDFFVDDRCRDLPFSYPDELTTELEPFLARPSVGPLLAQFLESCPAHGYVTDHLVRLNRKIAKEVQYIIRNEPGIQTSEETLRSARGSCRDSAALLVDAFRAQGLAARFVSGYLIQLADEGNIPNEARGVEHDVLDLHAWAEVYVPGAGWVGLDGTSGLLTGEGHVPLAGTVDPAHAAPVDGTTNLTANAVHFDMAVQRLGHEPRPRRPYTDEAWQALRALGRAVDDKLADEQLRLTMGGEPTWTSRFHPTAKEWNTDALGPTKWTAGIHLANELLRRLTQGGLLMQRMGKHYPGESLPRWALHLFWRRDGHRIWQDPALLDTHAGAYIAVDGRTIEPPDRPSPDAERFIHSLARELGLSSAEIYPGYEDPWPVIIEEAHLPPDVDPMAAELEDPEERRRLARILGRGPRTPVGYALPLASTPDGFVSSSWSFRRGHLFLIPGDSPMGLRLPLERLGGVPYELYPQDPSQRLSPLPDPRFQHPPPSVPGMPEAPGDHQASDDGPALKGGSAPEDGSVPEDSSTPEGGWLPPGAIARTALCAEVRAGVLHIFLPPLRRTEDFLTLVEALEATARKLNCPVRLEGYPPPRDPRLDGCMVTPDPGVIEVNLPVTEHFDDYVRLMETVTDAANHVGLTTEKYQLDGRETGSGGGHHLTLGGPTPAQSPFLARPELFASLLRYLQNHPALSYLFTGLFVGPTSQAPRIDEARHDALYELELALALAEDPDRPPPLPWLTDRLFRHLLADVSGNTHRAEVSIDKLYDPVAPSGRLGVVELRAFEMPPHEHMAIAQMLLMRGVVARLAQRPYREPLVRWGSQLHDRFMLPHFLEKDLEDVLRDLREAGLDFTPAHYVPFIDFKCPVAGQLQLEDLQLELRTALEPWPVLGEQGTAAGTVRYVDSSLERLQVRVDGLTPERHTVLVNGHRVPLRPTGRAAEAVAGVRFRAWQPPNALQPTIGIHHPLRFDVVDTWGRRSLGAATYHVWHPGGRGFEEPPLTAFEAAARRAQRLTREGHAPYPVEIKPTHVHPDQPFTLDLRRFDAGIPGPIPED